MLPTHISMAASRGDLDTIRAYFEDDSDGARDVDGVGIHGWTPLMSCAAGHDDRVTLRNVEVAQYLLSRGASIDKTDRERHTALLIACYCGRGTVTEMVKLLLSAGANANARNGFGRTALSAYARYCATPSVLARQGDNGVVWNVLSFWRATK